MKNKSLLVGITGGIGSGKTTICKMFNVLGIPTYNADTSAKYLMNNDKFLIKKIIQTFGKESYENDKVNSTYLANKVFNNEELLKKLNELVHPEVEKDFHKWLNNNSNSKILIKEAALLFEAGSYKKLDKVILVISPYDLKMKRIKLRDKFRNEEDIKAIIDKQWDDSRKIPLADFIIENNETLLTNQVLTIYNSLNL